MKRLTLTVLVASGLSLLVALAAPAGAVTKSQLDSRALSLSNMPTGWSVDNAPDSAGGYHGCLSGLIGLEKPTKTVQVRKVQYDDQTSPSFSEYLSAGKSTKDAQALYGRYVHVLNHCTTFSYTDQGTQVKGTVGAMSFPKYGSESESFAATATADGESAGADVVIFRVGQYVGNLSYQDSVPDNATAEAFATAAVQKVEGKAVTVPTAS